MNITLNWNTGIGFGLLSLNAGIQYHIVSALILLIIVYLIFLMTKGDIVEKIMFALIIGGAAGNLFDRLTYYAVPDFIDFHIENYHWFTFKVADIFITIGIVFIILREIFFGKENTELLAKRELVDAEPREIYIIGSLLVPIIGIGLYPRIMTETFTASIDGLVSRDKAAIERVVLVSNNSPVKLLTPLSLILLHISFSYAVFKDLK